MSTQTGGALALEISGQMNQSVDATVFTVKPWSDRVEISGQTAVVPSVYSIGAEIRQLKQACILCREEKRDFSQGPDLSPTGASASKALTQ